MSALIVNPRSGGGKATRFDLIAQCAQRGIEAIVLNPGDDLAELANTAIRDGADAIGMAGGDGSQATVAAIAAEHDVPFVCVPAGTRNHFAFDLGIDRNDVVAALDLFDGGTERRIDLLAADPDLAAVLETTWIDHVERGAERPSDHAALIADLRLE